MKKLTSLLLAACLTLPSYACADDTFNFLQSLVNANGAPGFEKPVRRLLQARWQTAFGNLTTDGMGNLLAQLPGSSATPKVLLMAHLDEVGFLIRDIRQNGFVEVEPVGGWRDQSVYSQRWIIQTNKGPVLGYSGIESGHMVAQAGQVTKPVNDVMFAARDMTLDVGATSRSDAIHRLGLRPGLPITPAGSFGSLNGGTRYIGKAFDDRLGLAAITQAAQAVQGSHPNTLLLAATTQEEVGLRGAQVLYNQIKPDVVINLEACVAGDFPRHAAPASTTYPALGHGPCLYTIDRSMIANNDLMEWVIKTAQANHIPYQFAAGLNYGQDGSALQLRGGMPVINIGIPMRYAHQEAGVMDRGDYDATVKLIIALVQHFDQPTLVNLGN